MSVLEVKNLNAWFGDHHVVKNISLDYPSNTISAIIGPSGLENLPLSVASIVFTKKFQAPKSAGRLF